MMKKIALFIFSVILGCCIGILLPVRPTVLGEETPLFSSWSTIFDWILRFLEPLGVVATIIVALFKEDLIRCFKYPKLKTDIGTNTFNSDDHRVNQNVEASRYYRIVKVENTGKATADDCQVVIDSISYKSNDNLQEIELLNVPQNIRWISSNNVKEDISTTCSRTFQLFQILPAIKEDNTKGISEIPISLMIGDVVIKQEHIGGEYSLTIKIEAKNMKSVVLKPRIKWTGIWHNQKAEMEKVLVLSDNMLK